MSIFSSIKDAAMSALFPRRCPLCGGVISASERVCGECSVLIDYIRPPICKRCGRPPFDCTCRPGDFYFDRCVSPFVYTKAIRSGIHRLKFRNSPDSAAFFGRMMARLVAQEYGDARIGIVCCVPLHPEDQRARGYNQAALLGKVVAHDLELNWDARVLAKTQRTSAQHTLSRSERQGNVAGIFEVARPDLIQGRTVLLCDDIFTTGNTLNECTRVLYEAGAGRVLCVTAATVCPSREGGIKRHLVG